MGRTSGRRTPLRLILHLIQFVLQVDMIFVHQLFVRWNVMLFDLSLKLKLSGCCSVKIRKRKCTEGMIDRKGEAD